MKTWWLLVITAVALTWVVWEVASQPTAPTVMSPDSVAISKQIRHGVDNGKDTRRVQKLHPMPSRGNGTNRDDVLQTLSGPLLSAGTGLSFPGVGSNGLLPPDTNMAVGPNHILQTVNSRYAIFSKSGALLVGPFSLSSIWAPLGPGNGCATNNGGDVVAQYDKLADRFIVTQLGGISEPFSECIAVSQTSDPAGAYWLYSYPYGTVINDYPKFGVWPTATNSAYLATYNLFADPQTFTGAQLCAYDRTKMLTGDPSAQGICYTIDNDGGYLPADLDGSTPPLDGTPGYFLNYETLSSLRMYAVSPNFSNPGASTLFNPGPDIPVAGFSEACPAIACVTQPGTGQRLSSVGDRMMFRLAFRNFGGHEAMVVNHSVMAGSRVGVRWYELRAPVSPNASFSLYQHGTYSPDSTHRWMGSAAMDQAGNIGIGYSASSGQLHPSIRYTGRQASDPLGTLQTEATILTGTGSQTGGISRWGDYSVMRIDPVDDCTFWYTNQYLATNGNFNWQTAFGSFKFTSCNPPNFSLAVSPSSLTVAQGAATNSTVTVAAVPGFSGAVGLTVTGCPANTTCTLGTPVHPNPTAISILDVFTTSNTSVGTHSLTITGTSGGSVLSTTVLLTVTPPPDFSISASPSPLSVVQVGTGTSTITVTALYGFTGNVNLAVTGCPTGATCSLPTPVSLGSSATSILMISLSTSTASGTYPLTITGTHGALTRTATLPLNVLPAGTLTNVALPLNGGTAIASSIYSSAFAASNAIDGDRKSGVYWNDFTFGNFPDWLEVDFNGTKSISEIDVFSVQDDLQSPINPTPTTTFTLYGLRNFEVQYWTGSAWTAVPGGTVTNNNLVWRKFTFGAISTSKIRVLVTTTADGLWSRIAEVEAYANLNTSPDFAISANPSSLTLVPGGAATSTVTVAALNGFSGNIDLAVTGCPSGTTCTLPTPVSPTATPTLTISTSTSASTGTFTLTMTGTQAAVMHTATMSLTINPPGTLTNVALPANGGAAMASSVYSSTLSAANAIDGDRKGAYWNDGTSNNFPDSLEVNFNGTKAISEIDVFSVQDNFQSPVDPTLTMTFTLYGLRNFVVQYWAGSAWAAVPGGTVTNNNLVWRRFTFTPLATSRIRVLVTATADGSWTRIAEVEAYSTVTSSPDFLISANPSALPVVQVGTGTSVVTVTGFNGFGGNVDLAITGCPTGATCSLPTPVSLGSSATSTLTTSLSTSTGTGTFPLTITGTQGALTRTATVSLNVTPAGTLTNVALPANGGAAVASSVYSSTLSAANAIDGDRKGAYWNDGTSNNFPDSLEVNFNGTKSISEIDVFSVQDNLQSPINPTPTTTFTLYGLRNFEVQYWTGSAWTAVPGGTVINNNLVWRKFTFAAVSTSKIRVLVTVTADGLWSRIAEVEAYSNLNTSPDFAISANPSSLTLVSGGATNSTVTVAALNGFSGNVNLAVTGCPSGTTCTLPTPVSPTATPTLAISTSTGASTGTFMLTISGTQNAVIHTSTVLLTIDAAGTNVALPANGGSATASSVYNSSLSAANAINEDRKGAYWNDATSNSFPDWLEVNFNGTKAITEIDVFSVQDNFQSPIDPTPTTTFTLYGLRNFEVQYWTGTAWAPIPGGTVTNNNLVWRKFTFASLTTSKIRVLITGTADAWSRIVEVEAYTGS